MFRNATCAIVLALLVSGCGAEAERAADGGDRLDAGHRADCAPGSDERVIHAWKGGRRYCLRVAQNADTPSN